MPVTFTTATRFARDNVYWRTGERVFGWALGLLAPRFLRPLRPKLIHLENWTGVAVGLVFEK